MNSRVLFFVAALIPFTTQATEATEKNLPLVTAKTVEALAFYPVKSAPAKVLPLNQSMIPARIGSVIEQLPVQVGDQVKKGDLIARLDCKDPQLALSQLKAELKQAKIELEFKHRDLERANTLAQKNSLTAAELDRKKTDVTTGDAQTLALNARLNQQQLNVDRCDILAPFDGLITQRLVSISEQVNPGQAVVELLQNGNIEVSAQVALSDSAAFEGGRQYYFEVGGKQYPLQVRTMLPVVNDNSRSVEARLEFTTQSTFSGVTGRVKWHSPTPHLPGYLLQQRDGQYGFFVLEHNKARFVVIEGAREGRPIKLTDSHSYQVIIDGRYGLTDQMQVKVNEQTNTLISTNQ